MYPTKTPSISEEEFESIFSMLKNKISNETLPLMKRQMGAVQIAAAAFELNKFTTCLTYCNVATMSVFPVFKDDIGRYRMLFFMKAKCLHRESDDKTKVREYLSSEKFNFQEHPQILNILTKMEKEVAFWEDLHLKECPVLLETFPSKDFHTLQCGHQISSNALKNIAATVMKEAQKRGRTMILKCPICRHVQNGRFIFITKEAILMTLFENQAKIQPPCLSAILNEIQIKLKSPFVHRNDKHGRRESFLFYTDRSLVSLKPFLETYRFQLILGKDSSRDFVNMHASIESTVDGVFVIIPQQKDAAPYMRVKVSDNKGVTEVIRSLRKRMQSKEAVVKELLKCPSAKTLKIKQNVGFHTSSFKVIRVREADMLSNFRSF